MPALPRRPQSVGALALQSPLALATFSPALRCVHSNAEFALLAGQDPDRMPGLAWDRIFPRTSLHDLTALRAIVSGAATGLPIALPGVRSARRRRDGVGPQRPGPERPGPERPVADGATAPACYPATAYLIDVPGAAPLLGVTSRRRHSTPWSTDDVGGLWTDTDVPAVSRRIDTFLRRRPWGPAFVVLLAASVETGLGRPGRSRSDDIDLTSLTSHVAANFRHDDCLSVLDGRWPVLACPIERGPDAGLLADRFRATVRRWRGATGAAQSFEFRMALGRRVPGQARALLALLEACADHGARPRSQPVCVSEG